MTPSLSNSKLAGMDPRAFATPYNPMQYADNTGAQQAGNIGVYQAMANYFGKKRDKTVKQAGVAMSNYFWNGFDKQANLMQSAVSGVRSLGEKAVRQGAKMVGKPVGPGISRTVGKGLQTAGNWAYKNPRKVVGGAVGAAAGAGGAALAGKVMGIDQDKGAKDALATGLIR